MRPAASSSSNCGVPGSGVRMLSEGHRVADRLYVVGVGAEHEHAMAADAVLVQQADAFDDIVDGLRLLVAVERRLVDRLEAEVHDLAA
jgi:hypothetical protein